MPDVDGALRHAQERLPHFPCLLKALSLDRLAKHGVLKKLNLRFVRGGRDGEFQKRRIDMLAGNGGAQVKF